jgi:hypothetical protein
MPVIAGKRSATRNLLDNVKHYSCKYLINSD